MELFRKEDLKWIKEKGDDSFNWEEIIKGIPGKIAEMGDGPIIGMFTNQLNKWLSPQLEDGLKAELHDVFDEVIAGNYKLALTELSDVATVAVDEYVDNEKIKPWILIAIEIYRGIILQLGE